MEQFANPETISISFGRSDDRIIDYDDYGYRYHFYSADYYLGFVPSCGKSLEKTDKKKELKAAESAATDAGGLRRVYKGGQHHIDRKSFGCGNRSSHCGAIQASLNRLVVKEDYQAM